MSKTIDQRQRAIRYQHNLRRNCNFKGLIRGGKRADLDDQYTRSTWEANYERYLNQMEIEWEYENKTFEFKAIKKGTRFYTPDFYLPEFDEWHEVKGRWDGAGGSKSKTQLRRFKKYCPEEFAKLFIVTGDIYGKSKTARSVRRFLLCDLELSPGRIINYTALDRKCKSIIANWEK